MENMRMKNTDKILREYVASCPQSKDSDLIKMRATAPPQRSKRIFLKVATSFACLLIISSLLFVFWKAEHERNIISLSGVEYSTVASFPVAPENNSGAENSTISGINMTSTVAMCITGTKTQEFIDDAMLPSIQCSQISVSDVSKDNISIGVLMELYPKDSFAEITAFYIRDKFTVPELSSYEEGVEISYQNRNLKYKLYEYDGKFSCEICFEEDDIRCFVLVGMNENDDISSVLEKIFG